MFNLNGEVLSLILLFMMPYSLIGLIRTILKTARLGDEGLIPARNDSFAALKYMLSHPTFGDVFFLPVQLGFCALILLTLGILKIFFMLLK